MIKRLVKISIFFVAFLMVTGVSAYLTLTFIIKGEDTVVVPDLLGKDVVYSLEFLTDLGLNTKIGGFEYNQNYPKNHVILQDPGPGAEIKRGRDISILLSKGPKVITMPNVIGLPLRQARLVIDESGLCIANETFVFADELFNKDIVLSQNPNYGNLVERDRCANLLVSRGPRARAYQMVNLKGLSLDEAVVLIERSHLQVGRFSYSYQPGQSDNIIVGQYPKSGYRIMERSPVDLVVNRKPRPHNQAGNDSGVPSGFFQYKLDAGFLKKHIQIRFDSMGVSSELYNRFMSPGEELWLLVPTTSAATLFLYEDGELVKTQVINTP